MLTLPSPLPDDVLSRVYVCVCEKSTFASLGNISPFSCALSLRNVLKSLFHICSS